jgi:hypothetical protein
MNGTSALSNSLTPGCQAPGFASTHTSMDLPSRIQGLRISQELPHTSVSSPFQSTIPQEQRWDSAYFLKGDHLIVSRDSVFVPRAMFGQLDLHFVTQARPLGRVVAAFSPPSASQVDGGFRRETTQQTEQHWLLANRLMYIGKWVALSGDSLLAAGSNAPEVYSKARALGVAVPFVAYIDPDDHLPFAGW